MFVVYLAGGSGPLRGYRVRDTPLPPLRGSAPQRPAMQGYSPGSKPDDAISFILADPPKKRCIATELKYLYHLGINPMVGQSQR